MLLSFLFLACQIFHTSLLLDLIDMKRFEFEARKDVAQARITHAHRHTDAFLCP